VGVGNFKVFKKQTPLAILAEIHSASKIVTLIVGKNCPFPIIGVRDFGPNRWAIRLFLKQSAVRAFVVLHDLMVAPFLPPCFRFTIRREAGGMPFSRE
jgi:hypothetical protein